MMSDSVSPNPSAGSPLLSATASYIGSALGVPLADETSPLLENGSPRRKGLSLFFGVFVPCVLSIFSVILFLRLGFVVGQAGFLTVSGMFILAYAVVILTVLSISAISTNGTVKGGGAYFMISRSLGPEFGGSIGIIFYVANVFGCALYVAGFVETLMDTFGPSSAIPVLPSSHWVQFGYSSAVLLLCLIVCIIGANAFARASFFIFLIVISSVITVLLSFFITKPSSFSPPKENTLIPGNMTLNYTGFSSETFQDNLYTDFSKDYTTGEKQNFQSVFAVLFNGCTGIMAGANMSGDLANPSKAIPWGTLYACLFTLLVYLLLVGLTSATTTRDLLINDYGYMGDINVSQWCVTIGAFAATLSAALSNLIGASRILEAISRDVVLGKAFLFFAAEGSEPIRAVLLSWLLVQAALLIGEINAIAPIVSMLFLLSYGVVNLACFTLRVQASPNFRPTFRYFTWHTALLGTLACFAIMFFVDPLYAAAAFFVFFVLFIIIHYRAPPSEWGDVSQALIYHQVRKYLLRLRPTEGTAKFWRPQILLLVSNPRSSDSLIGFINNLKKGGLYVLGNVIVEEAFSDDAVNTYEIRFKAWHNLIAARHWKAFVDVVISPSFRNGVQALLTTCGLGAMRPNTVMIGLWGEKSMRDELEDVRPQSSPKSSQRKWFRRNNAKQDTAMDAIAESFPSLDPDDDSSMSEAEYVQVLRDILKMGKNLAIACHFHKLSGVTTLMEEQSSGKVKQWSLDVWLPPETETSDLTRNFLLQMPTILQMVSRWHQLNIRVFTIVSNPHEKSFSENRVRAILSDIRVLRASVTAVICSTSAAYRSSVGAIKFESLNQAQQIRTRNLMMREEAAKTVAVFTYLPLPPALDADDQATADVHYVNQIRELTDGLPPTLLFHAQEHVVTFNDDAL